MQNFTQILFVMWRETVEAMLVVGILYAWLSHNPAGARGLKYLWGGVLAGLAGAFLLGLGIDAMNDALSEEEHAYFMAGMLLAAAILIVQMVFWMRRNGQRLKRDMEQTLSVNAQTENWWGVFSLAAIAVAREGSETVVFLSSLAMGSNGFASALLSSAIHVIDTGFVVLHVLFRFCFYLFACTPGIARTCDSARTGASPFIGIPTLGIHYQAFCSGAASRKRASAA